MPQCESLTSNRALEQSKTHHHISAFSKMVRFLLSPFNTELGQWLTSVHHCSSSRIPCVPSHSSLGSTAGLCRKSRFSSDKQSCYLLLLDKQLFSVLPALRASLTPCFFPCLQQQADTCNCDKATLDLLAFGQHAKHTFFHSIPPGKWSSNKIAGNRHLLLLSLLFYYVHGFFPFSFTLQKAKQAWK